MSIELYASLPNEVLYLVWINIDPLLKYSLNKENLNKYYSYCNNNIHFNNYNYYYYLIKHDLLIFSELVLKMYIEKLVSGKLVIKKHNTIYYKNLSFYSLIDFFHYYSNNSNNSNSNNNKKKKTKNFIIQIINKYNLTHLIKKIHKNNVNKNIRWNI